MVIYKYISHTPGVMCVMRRSWEIGVFVWVGVGPGTRGPQIGWIVPLGTCSPCSVPCSWGYPLPCGTIHPL